MHGAGVSRSPCPGPGDAVIVWIRDPTEARSPFDRTELPNPQLRPDPVVIYAHIYIYTYVYVSKMYSFLTCWCRIPVCFQHVLLHHGNPSTRSPKTPRTQQPFADQVGILVLALQEARQAKDTMLPEPKCRRLRRSFIPRGSSVEVLGRYGQ